MVKISEAYRWLKIIGFSMLALAALLAGIDGYSRIPANTVKYLIFDTKILFASLFILSLWAFLDTFVGGALRGPSKEPETLAKILETLKTSKDVQAPSGDQELLKEILAELKKRDVKL